MKKYIVSLTASLVTTLAMVSLALPMALPVAVQAQTATGSGFCYTFNTNLGEGRPMSPQDAAALTQDLTDTGFWTSGTPITTYNDAVASAIVGFQEKYAAQILTPNGLTYGTGYIGASTRAELNSLYGCTTTTTTSTPNRPVQCPVGYTCTPINQAPVFTCPSGYTCTPKTTNPTTPITQSSATIISPTAGQSFNVGDAMVIKWTPANIAISEIDLVPTISSGSSFIIAGGKLAQPNTSGIVSYKIDTIVPSGSYYINMYPSNGSTKITSQTFNVTSSYTQSSQQVPHITIISPNGGETLVPGQTYNITWNAQNISQVFDISITTSGNSNFGSEGFQSYEILMGSNFAQNNPTHVGTHTVIKNLDSTTMSYAWTVPTDINFGRYNKISVTGTPSNCSNGNGGETCGGPEIGSSANPFTITNPSQATISYVQTYGSNVTNNTIWAGAPTLVFGQGFVASSTVTVWVGDDAIPGQVNANGTQVLFTAPSITGTYSLYIATSMTGGFINSQTNKVSVTLSWPVTCSNGSSGCGPTSPSKPPPVTGSGPTVTSIVGPSGGLSSEVSVAGIWTLYVSDPSSNSINVSANWGDGSSLSSGNTTSGGSVQLGHQYTQSGTYTVTFTVTDSNGLTTQKSIVVPVS